MPRIRMEPQREASTAMVMREMGELGFLGATLEGYGCAGIGYVAYGLDHARDWSAWTPHSARRCSVQTRSR